MSGYIIRRLIAIPVMLLVLSFILFLLIWTLPGDAAFTAALSISETINVDVARERFGLDRPWYVQYGDWLGGIFVGDFGRDPTKPISESPARVRFTAPTMEAWGIPYYRLDGQDDVGVLDGAFAQAYETRGPVVVIIGAATA